MQNGQWCQICQWVFCGSPCRYLQACSRSIFTEHKQKERLMRAQQQRLISSPTLSFLGRNLYLFWRAKRGSCLNRERKVLCKLLYAITFLRFRSQPSQGVLASPFQLWQTGRRQTKMYSGKLVSGQFPCRLFFSRLEFPLFLYLHTGDHNKGAPNNCYAVPLNAESEQWVAIIQAIFKLSLSYL